MFFASLEPSLTLSRQALIRFPKLDLTVPLTLTDRQLFLLDFCSLIAQANHGHPHCPKQPLEKQEILCAQGTDAHSSKQTEVQTVETSDTDVHDRSKVSMAFRESKVVHQRRQA